MKKYRKIMFVVIILVLIVMIVIYKVKSKKQDVLPKKQTWKEYENFVNEVEVPSENRIVEITDWRLTLVNYENALPDDFEVELANIDKIRLFDARAIYELSQMMEDMKQDGITNVWVQSAYRSVEHQRELFEGKIRKYETQGKSRKEAEELVLQKVNKPGTSEHNLGLAIDFNYVDDSFDEMKGFQWLKEKAENYGFILRYKKEKETITKVDYEPWHWRYVGKDNATKMNELDMCLEEYVDYVKYGE